MNKIILIISTVILSSCTHNSDTVVNNDPKIENAVKHTKNRIKNIEQTVIDHVSYSIIEVDGHEFLCQYNGGMCLIPK